MTLINISAIIDTMKANPFETSPEQKAANLARARADRDALDEVRGFGSDGPVMEAMSGFGLRAMDVGEHAVEGFMDAAGDAATLPGTLRIKLGSRASG